MYLFVRVGRMICTVFDAIKNLIGCAVISFLLAVFTGGYGLLLMVPVFLYFAGQFFIDIFFHMVCYIEQSEQCVQGKSRMQTENVRESTRAGELAYARHSTNFRTVESGDFTFQTSGYRELRNGDRVVVRLFRWTPWGRIRDYDILGFDCNY